MCFASYMYHCVRNRLNATIMIFNPYVLNILVLFLSLIHMFFIYYFMQKLGLMEEKSHFFTFLHFPVEHFNRNK